MLLTKRCLLCWVLTGFFTVVQAKEGLLSDPTKPSRYQAPLTQVTTSVSAPTHWRLSAIIVRENQYRAVINEQIVQQGDVIDGVRILSIGAKQVRLADGRTLNLFTAITNK